MHIDFSQKNWLIAHFSARANWRSVFDARFICDDTRKGQTRQLSRDVSRFINTSGTFFELSHSSGAWVSVTAKGGEVTIADESGRVLVPDDIRTTSNQGRDGFSAAPRIDDAYEVNGTDLQVGFDASGNKVIMRGDQRVVLAAPSEKLSKPLKRGAVVHAATITDDVAGNHGIPGGDLVDVIKMVIARDLGLENDLDALNLPKEVFYTLETHIPGTNVPHMRPFERVRFLEKPWRDTTEFEGHAVAQPRTFFVEKADMGFDLITSLDQREAIWSQGSVLRAALNGATQPVRTLGSKAQAHHVLQLLARGETTRDERNREWNYIVINTPEAFAVADKIRRAMRSEFGLTARHCSVLTFEKGLCVLAMASKVVDATIRHSEVARDETQLQRIRTAAEDAKFTI